MGSQGKKVGLLLFILTLFAQTSKFWSIDLIVSSCSYQGAGGVPGRNGTDGQKVCWWTVRQKISRVDSGEPPNIWSSFRVKLVGSELLAAKETQATEYDPYPKLYIHTVLFHTLFKRVWFFLGSWRSSRRCWRTWPSWNWRREGKWSKLHPSAICPSGESVNLLVSALRVMLDVLEDLVPLAHLEILDQR